MNEQARTISDRTAAVEGASSGVNAALLIVLGALTLTALLYWPTSLEIADLWQDTVRRRYTHGWAVLAVAVWLIWRDRVNLRSIGLSPPTGGWVLVAIGSVGWLVGFNAGLLAITTMALPLLVFATVWAAAGWRLARRVAFPVLFLYFALPVWELLNPPLQSMTAFVNLWLARLVGIPVLMDEYVIHIPAGWFEIAGGCSGLHFLIVALGIAAVHGHVDGDDWRSRWLLSGLAALLALGTNWIRVFIIIVAGHLTNMQHFLVKVDHYYFGWFLFAFTLILYVYLSGLLPRRGRVESPSVSQNFASSRGRLLTATALSAATLALGPAWSLAESGGADPVVLLSPPVLDGWSGPESYVGPWRPLFANPDGEFLVAYRNGSGGEIALYSAAYRSQRQGKEVRGFNNSTAGESHRVMGLRNRELKAEMQVASVTEQVVMGPDGRERLIWSLFAVDGRPDPMGLSSQVAYGIRSLRHAPMASVIAFAAECTPDCEHARNELGALSSAALPALLSDAN